VFILFILAATIGFVLLECVNYIEHYGLHRKLNSSGRYEKVTPMHSWNSNHLLGRGILFNLSRHSDHHHMVSKKYQSLESHDIAPQMPTGYPGMILLGLIPHLWFRVMDKRIPKDFQ
jgi:alkane 1-monooxygenase